MAKNAGFVERSVFRGFLTPEPLETQPGFPEVPFN
jgi:hypothetical protein